MRYPDRDWNLSRIVSRPFSADPFLRVRVNGTKGQTTLLFVRTSELSPYQDDPDSLPNRLRNEKIAPRIEKIALKNGFIAPRNEKNKADDFDSEGVFRLGKGCSGVATPVLMTSPS
jgi:hypothetical protein